MNLACDLLILVRLFTDLKVLYVTPFLALCAGLKISYDLLFLAVTASMNLACDLLILVKLFTDLKVLCVMSFLALITGLKNLWWVYFVPSCFEVQQLLGISAAMLPHVLTVSKIDTDLKVIVQETRIILSIVCLIWIKYVRLFAVLLCLGNAHVLRLIIKAEFFTDLKRLRCEAMILLSGVWVFHSWLEKT